MAYTTIDDPTIFFNTKLYTGNGSTQSITSVNFQPDWVWIKSRSNTYHHQLYDSVRGVQKGLNSNRTNAEETRSGLTSFDSDGFSLGSAGRENNNGDTKVAWNWLAGGSSPAITYTVKVVSDSGNKYRFDDFGTSAVTLDLQEGGTYTFDLSDSSNDGHPMKFSETSNGSHGGGSTYSTGIVYQLDGASVTESNYVSNFNSASSRKIIITVSASAPTLYYFCHYHSGMGGQANTNSTFGSSNFSGSIQSKVSANTDAGFSIITWTAGSGVGSIGHGLGTPSMIIVKGRSSAIGWVTGLKSNGWNNYLQLQSTNANNDDQRMFSPSGQSDPTSTVWYQDHSALGSSGDTMVGYVFAEKKGYSKFGTYTGNGNADGAFVYTGFKPAFVIQKSTGITANWPIWDSIRNTSNIAHRVLNTDLSDAEYTSADGVVGIDILSNGFKMRDNNATRNQSGETYIYMAFAENPFVNSKGVPTNAR